MTPTQYFYAKTPRLLGIKLQLLRTSTIRPRLASADRVNAYRRQLVSSQGFHAPKTALYRLYRSLHKVGVGDRLTLLRAIFVRPRDP